MVQQTLPKIVMRDCMIGGGGCFKESTVATSFVHKNSTVSSGERSAALADSRQPSPPPYYSYTLIAMSSIDENPHTPKHDEKRALIEKEQAKRSSSKTLPEYKAPTTLGLDTRGFLLGYLLLCLGVNIYMALSSYGESVGVYYSLNSIFTAIGLYAMNSQRSSKAMLIYLGYFTASYLFAAFIGASGIVLTFQPEFCSTLGRLFEKPGNVQEICMLNLGLLRFAATALIVGELMVDLFLLKQLQKMYKFTKTCENADGLMDLELGLDLHLNEKTARSLV